MWEWWYTDTRYLPGEQDVEKRKYRGRTASLSGIALPSCGGNDSEMGGAMSAIPQSPLTRRAGFSELCLQCSDIRKGVRGGSEGFRVMGSSKIEETV